MELKSKPMRGFRENFAYFLMIFIALENILSLGIVSSTYAGRPLATDDLDTTPQGAFAVEVGFDYSSTGDDCKEGCLGAQS